MRFEIRSGGVAAILLAVALLSGGVFVLGLLAGYDVGRESQISSEQVATTYPLEPSPAADNSVAAASTAVSSPAPANIASPGAHSTQENRQTANAATNLSGVGAVSPPHPRITSEALPPLARDKNSTPGAGEETLGVPSAPPIPQESLAPSPGNSAPPSVASAEPSPIPRRMRRKPFDIQIQAAMDLNGANEMTRRLQQLGYQPHLVPTAIDGKTWYRVEVGPYATQAEAAAAELQLRQKYNTAFGGGARSAEADDSDAE
jgi:cell division septation protein DedD